MTFSITGVALVFAARYFLKKNVKVSVKIKITCH